MLRIAVLSLSLLGVSAVYADPAPTLSQGTIQAWCAIGHDGQAPDKLTAATANQFNLMWGMVQAKIAAKHASLGPIPANGRRDFWKLQASMGEPGSDDELIVRSWLTEISDDAHMTHRLPRDVGSLRAVAAQLRDALEPPTSPAVEATGVAKTRQALEHFSRFEQLLESFAPALNRACSH